MVQVGDKFKVTKSNFFGKEATAGAIVSYVREGHRCGLGKFLTDSGETLTFEISGDGSYPCHVEPAAPPAPKDPIEYLKSAHAGGDMIDPATMLRECYGITKTERVVVEWSEPKEREIKVGDKVRIVGPASFIDQSGCIGEIKTVVAVYPDSEEATYYIGTFGHGNSFWFPASSVEPV